MRKYLFIVYSRIFARKRFYKFHKFLYYLSLRGLGVLNWENPTISGEERFVKKILSKYPMKTVFDIGASVGEYSLFLRKCYPEANIYAFEPHPDTFLKLNENTSNQSIQIFNIGFGNQSGELEIFDYKNSGGSAHASLYKEVISEMWEGGQPASFKVKIETLNNFVINSNIDQIDLLKIDTEGNELSILEGASELISKGKINIIQFEFNDMNVVSRVFFRDFYKMLDRYQLYRIIQDGLIPINKYDSIFCEIFAFQNIVAIKKMETAIFKSEIKVSLPFLS